MHRKKRIPKLSDRPDDSGRYYSAYRDDDGKFKRRRFAATFEESQPLYHIWLAEHLTGVPVATPEQLAPAREHHECSWRALELAYLTSQSTRVREEARGASSDDTITETTLYLYGIHLKKMRAWLRQRYGEAKLDSEPFDSLLTAADFEQMFHHLRSVEKLCGSYLSKLKATFWEVVRIGKRDHGLRLSFTKDDVKLRFSQAPKAKRELPSIAQIQKLMEVATEEERLWIMLGIGCCFTPQDISDAQPEFFDREEWDMTRTKTLVPRRGPMLPQIWAHLQLFLSKNRRSRGSRLFTTPDGLPLKWVAPKTDEEREKMRGKIPVKRGEAFRRAWNELKDKAELASWAEDFYVLRHVGARYHGTRPGVQIDYMMGVMGHRRPQTVGVYMQALRPEEKPLIVWVAGVLASSDPGAWRKKPKKKRKSA